MYQQNKGEDGVKVLKLAAVEQTADSANLGSGKGLFSKVEARRVL